MKRFYLITNEVKDPEGAFTKKIAAMIEKHGGRQSVSRTTGRRWRKAEWPEWTAHWCSAGTERCFGQPEI